MEEDSVCLFYSKRVEALAGDVNVMSIDFLFNSALVLYSSNNRLQCAISFYPACMAFVAGASANGRASAGGRATPLDIGSGSSVCSPSSTIRQTFEGLMVRSATPSALSPLVPDCPQFSSAIPMLSAAYLRYAKNAFNMATFITTHFNLLWIAFTTAMTYFHLVASKVGITKVNEVVLVCGCLFVAVKVEHVRLKLDKLVAVAFAVDPATEKEAFESYKRMVVEAEMLICCELQFDFQKMTPLNRLSSVAPRTNDGSIHDMVCAQANKLLSYTYLSPLCTELSADQIADGLVHLVAESKGVLESFAPKLKFDTDSVVATVEMHLVEVLAQTGKKCNIDRIDRMLDARRKRRRVE